MAKLFGKTATPAPEVPTLEPLQDAKPTEKGFLHYHTAEKFLASFFSFSEAEPKEKGRRLLASMVGRNAKFVSMPNSDEVLRVLLPEPFVKDAKASGWTLTECIKHASEIIEAKKAAKAESKPKAADDDLKLLMSLLVNVRADASPRELLDELKAIIEAKGEAAVEHLDKMLEGENPRDPKGFLYLRRVKAK